jgi:excisionase family DNA binding protein
MTGSGHDAAPLRAEVANKGEAKAVPFAERLTCTISDACQATGISRAKMYLLLSSGSVSSTTVGRRRLIHVRSLKTLLKEE